jgi:hypothetical protein
MIIWKFWDEALWPNTFKWKSWSNSNYRWPKSALSFNWNQAILAERLALWNCARLGLTSICGAPAHPLLIFEAAAVLLLHCSRYIPKITRILSTQVIQTATPILWVPERVGTSVAFRPSLLLAHQIEDSHQGWLCARTLLAIAWKVSRVHFAYKLSVLPCSRRLFY